MGKSVLSFAEATTPLNGANIVYLMQGSGLDRDRKVTLETLRQYFTGQGNEFMTVLSSDAVNTGTTQNPHWVLTKDITSTANVILIVQGNGATPFDLNLIGSIPAGCKLTIINWNPALVTLTSNKQMIGGGTMHNLDWAEFIWSAANRWYAIVIPSRGSVTEEIDHAVYVEQQRASTAEAALTTDLGEEATARFNADYGLSMDLQQEASTRSNADIMLDQRITPLENASTEYELQTIIAADISLLRWSAGSVDSSSYFKIRRRQGILDLELNLRVTGAASGGAMMAEIVIAPPTVGSLLADLLSRIAEKGFIPDAETGSVFSQPGLIIPGVAAGSRASIVAPATSYMAYICERDGHAGQLSVLFFGQNIISNGPNGLRWDAVMSYNTRLLLQHVIL